MLGSCFSSFLFVLLRALSATRWRRKCMMWDLTKGRKENTKKLKEVVELSFLSYNDIVLRGLWSYQLLSKKNLLDQRFF